MSLGEGFGVGLRGWQGWLLLWKIREKGKGEGGGWVGTGKGTGKSLRKLCRNYPLAIYPLLVSPLLPVTSRPPIWQLAFFNFTTHELEDSFATPHQSTAP